MNNKQLQLINPNYSLGALVGGIAESVFTGIGWKAL